MNRQQAPQPVVRPLPVLTSATAARDLTISKPVNEDGYHEGWFIPKNFTLEAGEESIIPLILIYIKDNIVNLYIAVCDYGVGGDRAVDATGVTTNVLCNELPCAVGTSNIDDALNDLSTYLESLGTDGFEIDELAEIRKEYFNDARIDAIIDI